ncbi:MAG: hypothetical protein V8Q41_02900 [Anaerostipes hadrus]
MFDKIFSDKKVILELYNAIAQTDYTDESAVAAKRAVEECIEHGILKDILLKEKGVIEDMITVCYDEEIYKMREAEYNQELGEERGKEIGKLLQPEPFNLMQKIKRTIAVISSYSMIRFIYFLFFFTRHLFLKKEIP